MAVRPAQLSPMTADSRAADLLRWLAWYNHERPHASLDGLTRATMLPPAA